MNNILTKIKKHTPLCFCTRQCEKSELLVMFFNHSTGSKQGNYFNVFCESYDPRSVNLDMENVFKLAELTDEMIEIWILHNA